MTGTDLDRVTADDVTAIAREVWSFLGLELEPLHGELDRVLDGDGLCGVVGISGAWRGSVSLECSTAHAEAAAEAMFAAEPGTLSTDEVADALGELANMVGGNIKSLLPAPSALSVPSVTAAERVDVPGAELARRVQLAPLGAPLRNAAIRISVWRA